MAATRILYVQLGTTAGRIARVRTSKTGRTLYLGDRVLEPLGGGYKANYIDREHREYYRVSGPRHDGQDTLYPGVVTIDDDVREAYWRDVRGEPALIAQCSYRTSSASTSTSPARRRPRSRR